ncbi:hypothetical protein ACHAXR_003917 [Thalassiosira sp. AJA248-18]
MTSTILYKFRSGTTFEPLPLPGTSARLFDIKRAIVRAKKLDSSSSNTSLEFDLAIQNATTNEVYEDESMILPRGTRVIVRRVAAERGRGILSRMAQQGGGAPAPAAMGGNAAARDGFYTIRSRDREADDEFLDSEPPPPQAAAAVVDESKELEALKAVTDQAGTMYGSASSMMPPQRNPRDPRIAGQGAPPPPHFAKPPPFANNNNNNRHNRPNADPELRQQEMMNMPPQPKKRATGIPRTFLNLTAPPAPAATEGGEAGGEGDDPAAQGGDLAAQLQPSAQAFQALVNRSGGQSLSSASKRRDLDYALRLTAMSIPEHLQCGICHGIVKNAMLVPWDTEGRPTCESCIRDGLTKNGFTCPLTGTEGVSPDDLFPNVGLRKATEAFVKGVMEKMESIEQQIEAEEEEAAKKRAEAAAEKSNGNNDAFEDSGDGIVTKKSKLNSGKTSKKSDDDLLFGGDDEFGGDVFDVAGDEPEETDDVDNNDDEHAIIEPKKNDSNIDDNTKSETKDGASSNREKDSTVSPKTEHGNDTSEGGMNSNANNDQQTNNESKHSKSDSASQQQQEGKGVSEGGSDTPSPSKIDNNAAFSSRPNYKKDIPKRRGPPVGYVLGPAGAGGGMVGGGNNGMSSPPNNMGMHHQQQAPPPPPMMMSGPPPGRGVGPPNNMGRGGRGPPGGGRFYPNQYGGRGGGGGGRGGYPNNHHQQYPVYNNVAGGGRGPPPPQQGYPNQGGGRGGGFHRNQQWGDNNNGNDWNRKRPHNAMMEQQDNPGMHQGEQNHQQGGWGGPPPPPQGGRGYNPQFQGGRGGRFQGGGRWGGGGRGQNFRGRGGWGGRGRY